MLTTAKIRTPTLISGLTGVCMMLASWHAWSWGHTGHVEISRIAIDKLPAPDLWSRLIDRSGRGVLELRGRGTRTSTPAL